MKNILEGLRLEELKTRLSQLKQRERIVLILGILTGMFFFFVKYGLSPNLQVISEKRSEIAIKCEDIEMASAEGANLQELQQEYKNLVEKIGNFEAKIPKETKADVFVNDLTEMAVKHGVKIKSIKSGEIEKEGEYFKFTTQLDLVSEPRNLINFLDALAIMSRLTGIKEFEIRSERRFLPEVQVSLVISTYSMV